MFPTCGGFSLQAILWYQLGVPHLIPTLPGDRMKSHRLRGQSCLPHLQMPITSSGCYLCHRFWPTVHESQVPTTPSLGSINLLEGLTELTETVYLLDEQLWKDNQGQPAGRDAKNRVCGVDCRTSMPPLSTFVFSSTGHPQTLHVGGFPGSFSARDRSSIISSSSLKDGGWGWKFQVFNYGLVFLWPVATNSPLMRTKDIPVTQEIEIEDLGALFGTRAKEKRCSSCLCPLENHKVAFCPRNWRQKATRLFFSFSLRDDRNEAGR